MYHKYLLLLLVFLINSSYEAPPNGKKAAYRQHFRGTILYGQGRFEKANGFFQRAYTMVPENFNFAMSLAVCMGRTGNPAQAISLLQKSASKLRTSDPEFEQKRVMAHFFEGMIHTYSGKLYRAIPKFKKAIALQGQLKDQSLLSLFNNALGYAIVLDQGKGAHKKADIPSHVHIHERDLLKAMTYFEEALSYDGLNKAALHNFKLINDSLALNRPLEPNSKRAYERKYVTSSYKSLPGNILRALDMMYYDEVAFLLDISGSMVMEKVTCMGVDRFAVMKDATRFLLENLPEETTLGIGTVGGDCGTEPRLWIATGEQSRTDLMWSLDFLVPDGTTPLLNMLKESPSLFSDSPENSKAIFLISDGANICREEGPGICEWASGLRAKNITINILTFLDTDIGNTEPFAEYTCLADNTDGKILYLDNNRCSLEYFIFQLAEECELFLPKIQRVNCWGPAVKTLWGIFLED